MVSVAFILVTSSVPPALANDPHKRRPISEILIVLRIDGSQLRRVASLLIFSRGRSKAANVRLCRSEYERGNHDFAGTPRRSGVEHGRAVRAVPAWPLQPAASHRHGAADTLAGTPAGQRAKLPCPLLLPPARIRSVDRERGDAGFDAGPGLRLDAWHPQPCPGGGGASGHPSGASG